MRYANSFFATKLEPFSEKRDLSLPPLFDDIVLEILAIPESSVAERFGTIGTTLSSESSSPHCHICLAFSNNQFALAIIRSSFQSSQSNARFIVTSPFAYSLSPPFLALPFFLSTQALLLIDVFSFVGSIAKLPIVLSL